MKPRWNEDWLDPWQMRDMKFLGGINDCDLWLDSDGDIRFVTGERGHEWDYAYLNLHGDLTFVSWDVEEWKEAKRAELMEQAVQYITLFAPWVWENVRREGFKREAEMG